MSKINSNSTSNKTTSHAQTQSSNQHTYDDTILKKYQDYMDYMLTHHSRVIQQRFDGRAPNDPSFLLTAKHIYRFTDYLSRDLKRNNPLPEPGKTRSAGREQPSQHSTDAHLLIVKEQTSKDSNFHVHGIVLANGHARRNGHYIGKKLEHNWNSALGIHGPNSGLLNHSNQHGPDTIIIDKYKPDYGQRLQEAFNQAKYLAKTHTKELNAKGTWKATGTRIDKRNQPR